MKFIKLTGIPLESTVAILREVSTVRVLSYMRTEQLFLYVHQIESVSSNDNRITYDQQIVQNKISEKLYGWTLIRTDIGSTLSKKMCLEVHNRKQFIKPVT